MDSSCTKDGQRMATRKPASRLPDKLPMFIAREAEIQRIISLLCDAENAVVSIHGEPGFGKTAIAAEVSHKLNEDHGIPVIFTHLSTAATVNEMSSRICRDIGVNYQEHSDSSLLFWLRSIESKVVIIMSDVDSLLEEKSSFFEFVRLLRKNSNNRCQFATTSTMSFEIPGLATASVAVKEMDDESCIAFLRRKCPKHDDQEDSSYWRKLAELCGKIPLAMSIVSSQIDDSENSHELFEKLEMQPISPIPQHYVNRAMNTSYNMLDVDHKGVLVRLAVFDGSFDEDAVKAVMNNTNLEIKGILKNLVCRNLIKQASNERYSIHPTIKHFLINEGEPECERGKAQAKALMVEYYLKMGHDLTMDSYSKNGYKTSREALKTEANNIENVIKICCQERDATSDIYDSLTNSEVYAKSARLFSIFVRTIIPESTVEEFLQLCSKLAEERKHYAIKINFDCLLAHCQRSKSIGASEEYFEKMEAIEKEFQIHYEVLKEDKSLCAHYYNQYGRYLSRKSEGCKLDKENQRLRLQIQAREQLEKSLELSKSSVKISVGKADEIFSLLNLGTIWKKIATSQYVHKERKAGEESRKKARAYYKEALELSQENLGEHDLTSACCKYLGDQFLIEGNYEEAGENYLIAKQIRENLGLDASKKYVYLLQNFGKCLTHCQRGNEAIEILERARVTAEILSGTADPSANKAMVYSALAIAYGSVEGYGADAMKYAKQALQFDRIRDVIRNNEYSKLREIVSNHVSKD